MLLSLKFLQIRKDVFVLAVVAKQLKNRGVETVAIVVNLSDTFCVPISVGPILLVELDLCGPGRMSWSIE